MVDETTMTSADVGAIDAGTLTPATRADRLNAICAKVGERAFYTIITLPGTARRIVIDNPLTGDRIGAVGETIDDAIARLAAKVG